MAADDKSLRNLAAQAAAPARQHLARLEQATLGDVEAMRLLLRGGSVIDWHRLAFSDPGEVDRFLRVNEFDPDAAPTTWTASRSCATSAVEYLTRNFSYRIPDGRGARHAGARAVPARLVARHAADLRLHRPQGHARHASPGRPRAALQAAGLRRRGVRLRRGQGGQGRRGDPRRRLPDRRVRLEPQGARQRSSPSCSPRRRPSPPTSSTSCASA